MRGSPRARIGICHTPLHDLWRNLLTPLMINKFVSPSYKTLFSFEIQFKYSIDLTSKWLYRTLKGLVCPPVLLSWCLQSTVYERVATGRNYKCRSPLALPLWICLNCELLQSLHHVQTGLKFWYVRYWIWNPFVLWPFENLFGAIHLHKTTMNSKVLT